MATLSFSSVWRNENKQPNKQTKQQQNKSAPVYFYYFTIKSTQNIDDPKVPTDSPENITKCSWLSEVFVHTTPIYFINEILHILEKVTSVSLKCKIFEFCASITNL